MIRLSGVVKHLLIINVLAYLASQIMGEPVYGQITDVNQLGRMRFAMFYPSSTFFEPFQIVTHMFMHGDISHLFFNMIGLFFFGPQLENLWGEKKFLVYYFIAGFGALAIYLLSKYVELNYLAAPIGSINTPMLGASGAISGVVIGYALKFPNHVVQLLIPPIPLKAKYMAMIFIAIDLFGGFGSYDTGIAHFAHLGGALFGFLTITYWNKTGN